MRTTMGCFSGKISNLQAEGREFDTQWLFFFQKLMFGQIAKIH